MYWDSCVYVHPVRAVGRVMAIRPRSLSKELLKSRTFESPHSHTKVVRSANAANMRYRLV